MSLSFLSNITLASNEVVKPAFAVTKAKRSSADKNPTGADLRVFANGAIYPSKDFAEAFNLEYVAKDAEVVGNGLDILSSKSFPNTAHLDAKFLVVAIISKSYPKVDVFGSTTYYGEKDLEALGTEEATFVIGDPKSSVLDQGATTFGKNVLIPLLKEVYGFEFTDNVKFVDLSISTDHQLVTNDGYYYIPKPITKGEKAGQMEVSVRQNAEMYPLVLREELTVLGEVPENVPTEGAGVPEEVEIPEIDLTSKAETQSSVEPSIEDVLDSEEEIEVDGAIVDVEIDTEELEVTPTEDEDEGMASHDDEGQEESPEDEDEFGDISI